VSAVVVRAERESVLRAQKKKKSSLLISSLTNTNNAFFFRFIFESADTQTAKEKRLKKKRIA